MRDVAAEKAAARHRLALMLNTLFPTVDLERVPFRGQLLSTTTHAHWLLF